MKKLVKLGTKNSKEFAPNWIRLLLLFIIIFASTFSEINGQTVKPRQILRLTISSSGSSEKFTSNNQNYVIHSSIGQNGIGGAFLSHGYAVRQGFIQPFDRLPITMIKEVVPIQIKATAYPNPANDFINIVFDNEIEGEFYVQIYNLLGQVLIDLKYNSVQEIQIPLLSISDGHYVLKIIGKNTQIIKHILKNN